MVFRMDQTLLIRKVIVSKIIYENLGGNIMLNKIKSLVVEEQGQGMTEYGLVLGAIAIGVLALLLLLRDKIKTLITNVTNGIPTQFNN